jgi:succinoglycan biosynthesis protein ExoL
MKMLFISNNWADAHQQTRLNGLIGSGFIIHCLGVYRQYYPVQSPITPIDLGTMGHANYQKRLGIYWRLMLHLWKNASHNDYLYVFGFDLMLITLIYKIFIIKKIKIIYEIPDIREIFFLDNYTGKLIRAIEERIIPKIDLLIVTSPEFISEYFVKFRGIRIKDYLVMENKIHADQIPKGRHAFRQIDEFNRKIRIGYFGVLRCQTSLNCLIALAEINQFEIILRGIFMPETNHYAEKIKYIRNIFYYGPYQVPERLGSIYNQVDIVWAAYPFSKDKTGNHLWARTNRFYESLFFNKPIILQKCSADAKKAQKLGNIAVEIDMKNEEQVVRDLMSVITPNYLKSAGELISHVTQNNYQITSEYKNLVSCLQQKK